MFSKKTQELKSDDLKEVIEEIATQLRDKDANLKVKDQEIEKLKLEIQSYKNQFEISNQPPQIALFMKYGFNRLQAIMILDIINKEFALNDALNKVKAHEEQTTAPDRSAPQV